MPQLSPNTKGALLMVASMASFTFNDGLIKATGGAVPLFQMLTFRGALALLLLLGLALLLGQLRLGGTRLDWGLAVLRALAELTAAWFFLTALLNMPIANVTAILQCLPLTVTLGAALIFGEPVGWRRMLAIGVGFLGMLLIVRPGPEGFDIHAIYGLMAVLCVTLRDLATRRISPAMPSMTVTIVSALVVTLAAALLSLGEGWVAVAPRDAGLIAGAAVFIVGGYLFSVLVMRVGDVSFVAPFRYSGLLWALAVGWFAFGDWPDVLTLLGSAVVVGSGLFMLYREALRSRARTRRAGA